LQGVEHTSVVILEWVKGVRSTLTETR